MESLKLLPDENPLLESCPLPPPHNELWLCFLVAGSFSCSLLPLFPDFPLFYGGVSKRFGLVWASHGSRCPRVSWEVLPQPP